MGYSRILVPLDGSPAAACGVKQAVALAAALGARVRFMHVLDPRLLLTDFEPAASAQSLLDTQRDKGQRLLDDAVALARGAGVEAEPCLCSDPPQRVSDLILEQARQWPADLVVMGTHGHRGLRRFALGSDADAVLHGSPVPVMLVRMPHP